MVTGIKVFNGKLIVNGVESYDAPSNNTHTTIVVEDTSDIANSVITGYYEIEGRAHIAGWITEVPSLRQNLLEGEYLFGNAPNYSISSRYSMGISAFVFDVNQLTGPPTTVLASTNLLDYSLATPLYADYNNYEIANYNIISTNGTYALPGHTAADIEAVPGDNKLWTGMSRVGHGFIVPNSRTYLTIGASAGHVSGIGYKARQNGQTSGQCPGPCAYDRDDSYNYYWLWDVNDLLAVKNGLMQAYDVRPYAYGVFNAPFQMRVYTGEPRHNAVKGSTYDPISGLLYLTISGGGSTGQYGLKPVIVAYKINNTDLIFTNSFENN